MEFYLHKNLSTILAKYWLNKAFEPSKCYICSSLERSVMEEEITPIQAIKVQDFESTEFDLLEKYQGKPLLILIYNNQCLGCTGRAIPLAYQYQQEYEALQVIGIHSIFNKQPVTEADIKSIFTIGEIPFPIYLDQNHQVYDQFQSEGTPQWLLITAEGMLYRSIFGSQLGAQNRLMYALDALCS